MPRNNPTEKDFILVNGADTEDFINTLKIFRKALKDGLDKNQAFLIGSAEGITIELFSQKDGIIYTNAEALYKIVVTDYDDDLEEMLSDAD